MGPNIEPWGTSNKRVIPSEKHSPMLTLHLRFDIYDLSHDKTVPVMQNLVSNVDSNIL